MQIAPFKYADAKVPPGYECSKCKKNGLKLWRQYQTFADHISLLCGVCALENQPKEKGPIDSEGNIEMDLVGKTCCIGWLVPAIPTEDGDTFWGYTSVPQPGVDWWRKLPTGEAQCS